MNTQADQAFMQLALEEARRGLFTTTPNPRVGCVFVKDGQVIASGFHAKTGEEHAEAAAITKAVQNGVSLRGSTAYVTLEPCSHQGRTPPCTTALLQAEVARVVSATLDPNPQVCGRGVEQLKQGGVQTEIGVLGPECRWLNRGFFMRMQNKRPWVRLKTATSADGFIALPDGSSQWITGPEARAAGHWLRAQACAVLTGIGTVQADNPQLNVRGIRTPRQPIKIVLDSALQIDSDAKLLQTGTTWLAHTQLKDPGWLARHPNANGINLIHVSNPTAGHPAKTQVHLPSLLTELAQRGIQELHLEAGTHLNTAFFEADLVDEIVQFIAPRFLGQGQKLFNLPAGNLEESDWVLRGTQVVGSDIQVTWVRKSHLAPATSHPQ